MAFYDSVARLWKLGRELEEALALHDKVSGVLVGVDQRLRELEQRMTYLEANQTALVVEAKSASSAAASVMASNVAAATVSDLVTRLTRVEMRLEGGRQPPAVDG